MLVLRWLKHTHRWMIFGVLSLSVIYLAFLFFVITTRYLSTSEEINQRIESLKDAFRSKGEKVQLKDSLYFETPLVFMQDNSRPSKIYDRNKRVIGEFSHPGMEFIVNIRDVPSYFIKSLIITEDRKFYRHIGFNLRSIFRAAIANMTAGRVVQGGSTLTQQLAKILFTTREKKISRKLYELLCAIKLERSFTKNELLLLYCNTVYFGHGTEGLAQASKTFFNKKPSYLNAAECSHLVAVIANPTLFSPYLNPENSKKRHWHVFELLAHSGGVSLDYARHVYKKHWARFSTKKNHLGFNYWTMRKNKAPYYIESVRQRLTEHFSRNEILEKGLQVHTGLDIDFDRIGYRVLKKHLEDQRANEREGIEGALVAIDNVSGEIVTAVGGSGFSIENQLRRYEQASRPVGSLAKPLIYLLAFKDLNRSPTNLIKDEPLEIKIPGRIWRPKNYDRKYQGEITYSQALISSRNIPAIKLLQEVGVDQYRNYLQGSMEKTKFHIEKNLSIALGSYSMSPVQVATTFSRFARGGAPIEALSIKYVVDRFGKKQLDLIDRVENDSSQKHESYSLAYHQLYTELEKVLSDPNGTAYQAYKKNPFRLIRAAGKTGTSQDRRDAWFVGFTPQITCAVWIGYDDNRKMKSGSGGSLAAPIWMEYIKGVYRYLPVKKIEAPMPKLDEGDGLDPGLLTAEEEIQDGSVDNLEIKEEIKEKTNEEPIQKSPEKMTPEPEVDIYKPSGA